MKIAASLEDVNGRLAKIEEGIPGTGNENGWGRRKSSYRQRSLRSNRLGSYVRPSLGPVPNEDVGGENGEDFGYLETTNEIFHIILKFCYCIHLCILISYVILYSPPSSMQAEPKIFEFCLHR